MAVDVTKPDPTPVLDLIEAFRRSKVLFAAVKLGVFDQLAAGPLSSAALAQLISAHADTLDRLLSACVGLKLLEYDGQRYRNAAIASAYLVSTSDHRLTGYLRYSDDVTWKLWEHLDDAVRDGTHRWEQAFGLTGDIFANLFQSDAAREEFLWGMHGYGLLSSPRVVAAFDLSRFRHLTDLGGATGHLAVAACERYPELRATVFDLPGVAPLARRVIASSRVFERVTVQTGDFFRDPLPSADLYSLGRILHDWSEEKIRLLLARVHEALTPGGAILIAEKILHEDKSGPIWGQMQDLNMLTCTEGRERTLAQYETLLNEAGFTDVKGCRTDSPLDAILATKRTV